MSGFNLIIQPDEDDAEAAEVLVDGAIGGNAYRFLLDTGAARTSVRYDDYTSTFASTGSEISSGLFASGSEDLIVVPSLELGPISRRDVTVVRSAAHTPDRRNVIGMDVLKDYAYHVLFGEHRVVVGPEAVASADVPFHALFLDQRAHPYLDARFGDQRASAVWDTGAGITVVDLSFVKRHPAYFREIGDSTGTDSRGVEMRTPMFVMTSVRIGNHVFPAHTVAGIDLAHVNSTIERPMDLIIGYSTMSKANWIVDFPHQRWAISRLLG